MRRFFVFLATFLFGPATSAYAQTNTVSLDAFFELIALGSADDIAGALQDDPTLAVARDKYEFQAIHLLDYADFNAKLAILLAHGADINAQNDEGVALLHILIDFAFMPEVLNAGADLELADHQGRTPLLVHLSEPDSFEMVAALLDAGADPRATDHSGQSAIDYARLHGDPDLEQMIQAAGG